MPGNDDHQDCRWTPTGPLMEEHWKRIVWDFKHLFKKTKNPYNNKEEQPGYKDIQHAAVNIPVEYARLCPHRAGHYFWITNTTWIVLIIILLIWR